MGQLARYSCRLICFSVGVAQGKNQPNLKNLQRCCSKIHPLALFLCQIKPKQGRTTIAW